MERETIRLDHDFRFMLFPNGECEEDAVENNFDDSLWKKVRVPHDWAASGEFGMYNDCTYSAVTQDGIDKPIEHCGRTGALPIVGLGVYRLPVYIPEEERKKDIFLEFDGVMWDSDIYVNGKHVFFNHFGYKSFSVDIGQYVEYGKENLIAVKARVYDDCSRWYPGAGIYRNVYLVKKNKTHINYNGIWIRQIEMRGGSADFLVEIDYTGDEDVYFTADIYNAENVKVASVKHDTYLGELSDIFKIENVKKWDVNDPYLYKAQIKLFDKDGTELDGECIKFGARESHFTPDGGYFLNGRKIKINGVCNHHDMGSLGAAVNKAAIRRQLRIMRDMGVNAIRTSHNPPAPELLELCDEMGFLVLDEFFDEWYLPKVKNGYSKYYREHAASDIRDVIRRDRNHPSVIMWSIGNEIDEQGDKEGWRAAKMLSEAVRMNDPDRPVTAGLNNYGGADENFLTDFLDILGLNYSPLRYKEIHEEHPEKIVMGTETASCVSTRGVYHLPAKVDIPVQTTEDLCVSAYEMAAPAWAYYPEREWASQDDCPWVAGEFIWTGFDYLGEPTPYYSEWPSRSSYFGAVDMAGLPKNRFYGYKAKWTKDKVLHIFPHWNFEGHEGETVPVHVYSSYPEAELFINGKSYGRKKFSNDGEIERYRLVWDNAVYEPGEVKVVAYDKEGNSVDYAVVKTAGKPCRLILAADREAIAADGDDLVYVTASAVDADGNVCPNFDERIYFDVSGAELLTTDAGDERETESFARPDKKAHCGYLVACVRSEKDKTGNIKIKASCKNLKDGEITVKAL